ncbi:DNA repair protein RadC [Pelotomaculum isophthalicicum JI]|uniref:DNA repair protein RadC n=2 Tax=Pelotomaculum TaxID=191373 RepID=A0A9X4H1N7_9FIRM|nr:DNA repair protein RadC [Pelotomaculum isophthalicicum]MDF9408301.1 DNA repair protein RadC [Pelotomaculum isophthalicicum JI]
MRPRERLLKEGAGALSEIELLAILLGTGSPENTVLELASLILTRFRSLRLLVDATIEELSEIKGVGLAKASQVKAALELARRLSRFTSQPRPVIKSPADAAGLVMEEMRHLDREHFRALLLNTRNQVVANDEVSIGTLNTSSVHPRELFRNAIKRSAASLVLVHNHPSGDATPSKEDLDVTRRLCEAGRIIGIEVLDHIIIGDNKFTSFKAEGLI